MSPPLEVSAACKIAFILFSEKLKDLKCSSVRSSRAKHKETNLK